MPGAEVPAAGEIGDDAVTFAEQETNLENLAEAVRRGLGVGVGTASTYTISAGAIAPTVGVFAVDTEGAVASDNLDTINVDAYLPDSLILLRASSSARTVVVRHLQGGSGQIRLADPASSFSLEYDDQCILLRLQGTIWTEVFRGYGIDRPGARDFLGLGSAALLDDGDVDAATLEGNAAADFLPVAAQAADSALLGGFAAANFVRNNLAALQTLLGALQVGGGLCIVNSALGSVSSEYRITINSVTRGRIYVEPVSAEMICLLLESDGTTVSNGFRLRDGEVPEYWDKASANWAAIFDPATSLSAFFPGNAVVRWDYESGIGELLGPAQHLIHAETPPELPGTGLSGRYMIDAGITTNRTGSNGNTGSLQLYYGPNGDETDSLVAEAGMTTADGFIFSASLEQVEVEVPTGAGNQFSVVLNLTSPSGAAVRTDPETDLTPPLAGAYLRTRTTYLYIEQLA